MSTGGGDPVEEASQAVRSGFIQAFQSASMTANLLQRRGAESRSVTEHYARQHDREAEQWRKTEIHSLQTQSYLGREGRAQELFRLERDIKTARLQYMNDDAARKAEASEAFERRHDKIHGLQVSALRGEHNHKDALHREQMRGYARRAAYTRREHDLDVEYKRLLIEHRRRVLGFTETLAHTTDPATAAAAAAGAQWAAAHSTADLSGEHQQHSDAYAERYAEDTGADPRAVVDAELIDDRGAETGMTASPVNDLAGRGDFVIDAEVVEETAEPHLGAEGGVSVESSWSAVYGPMAGLAEELTYGLYTDHLLGSDDPDDTAEPGESIGEAVSLIDSGTGTEPDVGIDAVVPSPESPPPAAGPQQGPQL
ncbi:hypothetical protein [Nocardia wallacei]|uniref:hypothetical protein n=1 Tax=Nocardia wallacei TaxID=480035 RepID=UPI00245403D4|nr:hypothetical protein [Nocardia wallacei]